MISNQMKEGTRKLYGLRSKGGVWVCIRSERNPSNRYACCETSHYAYLPRYLSKPAQDHDGEVWLLPSREAILDCLTKETKYYNADSAGDPVLEFDLEDDELEIVEVEQTLKLKAVPSG